MQDNIEKSITIAAPITTVWTALTDHNQFGEWFLVKLNNPFELGKITTGTMRFRGYEGLLFWAKTVRMAPPNSFSFRWPYAEDIAPQYADDPAQTTLVEFTLIEVDASTQLTVKESGFEALPKEKRLTIFRDNTHGWEVQTNNIRNYAER